jgi:hypothetical protein
MNCALHFSECNCGKNLFPLFQSIQCTKRINHFGQRRMVSCFIAKGLVLYLVKMVSSFYFLDRAEWNIQHFISIFINVSFAEVSALSGYQFVFFSYCAKARYDILVAYAEQHFIDFQYNFASSSVRNIQLLEGFANLHSQIAKAFIAINKIFSKEVNINNSQRFGR